MNDKKSPFGDLCHQYRVRDHLTQQEMGVKIEELEHRLWANQGGNKQPLISQFEREIDPEGAEHKQHRDPPLDYVEACAKLFNLSSEQKYALFEAALQSSEKIVISTKSIEGNLKDNIIQIITSLMLLPSTRIGELTKLEEEERLGDIKDAKLLTLFRYWSALKIASKNFIKEIRQFAPDNKSPLS
jgi:hypothetical protein